MYQRRRTKRAPYALIAPQRVMMITAINQKRRTITVESLTLSEAEERFVRRLPAPALRLLLSRTTEESFAWLAMSQPFGLAPHPSVARSPLAPQGCSRIYGPLKRD